MSGSSYRFEFKPLFVVVVVAAAWLYPRNVRRASPAIGRRGAGPRSLRRAFCDRAAPELDVGD